MQLAVDTIPSSGAELTRHETGLTRRPLRSRNATHCGSVAWACVHTHVGAEHWAQANLRDRGYTTWLPLVAVRRRDRVVRTMFHNVQVPAFSRYVFLQHTPGSPWSPIRYTEGVNDVVRMGMQPAYASDMAIEAVRKALEADAGRGEPQDSGFPPGTPLRWAAGPLKGFDAIALRPDGDGRTRISVIFLGGLQEITALNHQLVPRD